MSVRGRFGLWLLRVSYWLRSSIPAWLPASALIEYNARVFGRLGPDYIALAETGFFESELELMDRFDVRAGQALCLGCGAGREAFALAAQGLDVLGVDQVPVLIAHATSIAESRHLSARFIQADYVRFDPQGRFDYAFLLNCAFSYIPGRRQRAALLTRLKSALRPGGLCMVSYIVRAPRDRERRRHPLLHTVARLVGNRDYELGDRIMVDDAFAHYFSSDDAVRHEAEACGFRAVEFLGGEGPHIAVLIA